MYRAPVLSPTRHAGQKVCPVLAAAPAIEARVKRRAKRGRTVGTGQGRGGGQARGDQCLALPRHSTSSAVRSLAGGAAAPRGRHHRRFGGGSFRGCKPALRRRSRVIWHPAGPSSRAGPRDRLTRSAYRVTNLSDRRGNGAPAGLGYRRWRSANSRLDRRIQEQAQDAVAHRGQARGRRWQSEVTPSPPTSGGGRSSRAGRAPSSHWNGDQASRWAGGQATALRQAVAGQNRRSAKPIPSDQQQVAAGRTRVQVHSQAPPSIRKPAANQSPPSTQALLAVSQSQLVPLFPTAAKHWGSKDLAPVSSQRSNRLQLHPSWSERWAVRGPPSLGTARTQTHITSYLPGRPAI